jgi:hypothetical protein
VWPVEDLDAECGIELCLDVVGERGERVGQFVDEAGVLKPIPAAAVLVN